TRSFEGGLFDKRNPRKDSMIDSQTHAIRNFSQSNPSSLIGGPHRLDTVGTRKLRDICVEDHKSENAVSFFYSSIYML
ncbi:unnamed protein product, partial [Brassica rapa subsp. narinosa]